MTPTQQLAIVDNDILDMFQVDTIELGRGFCHDDKWWADWVLPDGTPCQMPVWVKPVREKDRWVIKSDRTGRIIAQMPDGALYFEQTNYPYQYKEDDNYDNIEDQFSEGMWTALAAPPGTEAEGEKGKEILEEGARKLRQSTDRAIIGLFGGNLLEMGQFFYRNDNFFLILAGEPEKAHKFLDKIVEYHLKNLESFLGTVGKYIDVVLFGDDLGMQTGPQISPAMYREFFKPRHKLLWNKAKELANVKVLLHSCGGIRELLPDLIDAGLDAVNPVQISCAGMNLAGLRKDFAGRMVFWGGGCDTQKVLTYGTPADVRKNVREQVDVYGKSGGFVFQQVHNILANVPPENIVAMFEEVNK